jgi:hexosaminidase
MSWRGTKGGIKAVEKGFDVVMSPNTYCYIDWYQTKERDKEPYRIGKYLPIEVVYGYEPMEGMPGNGEDHIYGVQANLWSEFLPSIADMEYMLLPRMSAISEVEWSPKGSKDFDRFRTSLDHMKGIYETLGFVYCKALWGQIGLPGHEIPARTPEELDTLDWKKVPLMEE